MLRHQSLQFFPFSPVHVQRLAQELAPSADQGDRRFAASDLHAQVGMHCERVEAAFGDFYGVCACGARSLALVTAGDAYLWRCPRHDAEVECARNERRWLARNNDAQLGGVVR